jgi:hypothetical protein
VLGEVGRDGGRRKLGVCKGRIEGHRGRIEDEGGWIVVHGCRIGSEMEDVGMKVAAAVTWPLPLP